MAHASSNTGRNRSGEVVRRETPLVPVFVPTQVQFTVPLEQALDSSLSQIVADSHRALQILRTKVASNEDSTRIEFSADDLNQLVELTDGITRYGSQGREITRSIASILRQQNAGNAQQVIAELKEKISEMELKIAELEKKLQMSRKQVSLLTLRQLLRSIETSIYKNFVPKAASAKRDFKLSELDKKAKSNSKTKEQLDKLLKKIGFDRAESVVQIRDLIEGYGIDGVAHCDLTLEIPEESKLDEKLEEADITDDDDRAMFKSFCRMYFKLKEELKRCPDAYSEIIL